MHKGYVNSAQEGPSPGKAFALLFFIAVRSAWRFTLMLDRLSQGRVAHPRDESSCSPTTLPWKYHLRHSIGQPDRVAKIKVEA
jgi:hypothetical protein